MEPTNGSPNDDQPAARLASAAPEERRQLLRGLVLRRASEILDVPSLDEESNFLENGLSSLNAVKLSKFLMDDTGIEVPLVSIVEHPTSTLLGTYLAEAYAADAR